MADCPQYSSPEPMACRAHEAESPPSYDGDALLQSPLTRRKFNIQPREDEGRETLPPYSCTLSLENVFLRKMELEGAVQRAHDRNWNRVYVSLQGTALTFHKPKSPGYFSSMSSESPDADVAVEGKKGPFLRSYNLQHADVGIAADYFKKRYVIRVRAESDQFLLSCFKIETFVHWLQALFAAIDLALPLDDRPLPRDLSIPRRRRRRTYPSTSVDVERNATSVREQCAIIRSQNPELADSVSGEAANSWAEPATEEEEPQRPATSSAMSTAMRPTFNMDSFLSPQRTQSTIALSQFSSSESLTPHPSVSPDTGKWSPEHEWSAMYDMIYAKRCMAILTSRSPRKTNFMIMKGKQWVVDWATGALTRCGPPDYGEIEASQRGSGGGGIWSGFRARMGAKG